MEISPISNDSSAKFKANVKFTVDYANADSNTIDNNDKDDYGGHDDNDHHDGFCGNLLEQD